MRNLFKRQPRPIDKPTLKQRAAALKATAARLIRKPKNGPNADADLCALAGPWEAACRLYDRRIEEQSALERAAMLHLSYPGEQPAGADPDWQDFHQRWLDHCEQSGIAAAEKASGDACLALGDIEDQIAALPARTLAGLQIKARVAERNSSIDVEWPQGLGDGLVADLLSLTGSLPAVPVAPQPVPAIGADPHLVAMVAEWQDVRRKIDDPATLDDPEADALADRHQARQMEIYLYPARTPLDLLAKVPALRDELDAARPPRGEPITNSLPATAWTGLLADIERVAGTPSAPVPSADAELIEIGRAFEAATVRDQEAFSILAAAEGRAAPLLPQRPSGSMNIVSLRQAADEIVDETERSRAQAYVGKLSELVDAWEAGCARIEAQEGVPEAQAAADKARAQAHAVALQAAALPARTLDGVWVKVRIAAWYGVCDPTASTTEGYPGDAAVRSLYRDAPRLILNAENDDIRIVPEA